MHQVFQAMRDDVQGRSIDGALVVLFGFQAFGPEKVVDFFLNTREFTLRFGAAYPPGQTIERIEDALPEFGLSDTQKLPGGGEDRGDATEYHRPNINVVTVFV